VSIKKFHWRLYSQQHDDHRGEPLPLWFNIIMTATTLVMLVIGGASNG